MMKMSKVCNLNGSCKSCKGLCKHEKSMLWMFLVIGAGLLYWAFV